MTDIIESQKFSSSHEWVSVDDDAVATVGISDYAQRTLGDIVFVELPVVGSTVMARQEVAVVESVKAASDIYTPVSGEVTEVNEALQDSPETINNSPQQDGWLFRIKLSNTQELEELLDPDAYAESCD